MLRVPAFPREFGRYKLTGLLGSGGSAEVYRAETKEGKKLAIKRIVNGAYDRSVDSMLLDEARIWRRLAHANIVGVHEFGEQDGDWFLALELVEGMSLADLLKGIDFLPIQEALAIAERLALALDYAHSKKDESGRPLAIVHRDVKPANILLSSNGDVKLTDFGIARAVDRLSKTQIGVIKGSVYFLSPEQARGAETDGRSDLFSLGTVLHVMLTGSALIDAPDDEILDALGAGRIPEPPLTLPQPVRELLASLTAAEPRDRPASGGEVSRKIRTLLGKTTVDDALRLVASRVRTRLADDDDDLDRETRRSPLESPSEDRTIIAAHKPASATTARDLGREDTLRTVPAVTPQTPLGALDHVTISGIPEEPSITVNVNIKKDEDTLIGRGPFAERAPSAPDDTDTSPVAPRRPSAPSEDRTIIAAPPSRVSSPVATTTPSPRASRPAALARAITDGYRAATSSRRNVALIGAISLLAILVGAIAVLAHSLTRPIDPEPTPAKTKTPRPRTTPKPRRR